MTVALSAESLQDMTNVEVYRHSGALKDQGLLLNPREAVREKKDAHRDMLPFCDKLGKEKGIPQSE